MATNKEKLKYIDKLKNKYRLNILNDETFEEVWAMRLSRLNVISVFGGAAILIVILVIALIAFTPIREFIPGYPDGNTRRNIVINALKADSLERELKLWKDYYNNINNILRGGEPVSVVSKPDSSIKYKEIRFTRSVEDSLLRMQIEENEMYNLFVFDGRKTKSNISTMLLFAPIKGVVTSTFSLQQNHFGVDIVAAPNEPVVAVADGTVTLASWTTETGNVLQIQHDDNLISVYKHNSQLLKKQGARVKAGETIAIIGNSGELTTGPHLHFELWHNGNPIDPEKYIVF